MRITYPRHYSNGSASMTVTMEVVITMVTVALVTTAYVVEGRDANFSATYRADAGLNHSVVDDVTGRVYVGAVNKIYQLNANLGVEVMVETGPVQDSPYCTADYFEEDACVKNSLTIVKQSTLNYNKLLVLDPEHHHLITCGSVMQGTCQTRNMSDVTSFTAYNTRADHYVAANDRDSSTVGFIGPGPGGDDVLYVATTFTGVEDTKVIRDDVPTISSRNVEGNKIFRYANTDGLSGDGTYLRLDAAARDAYVINYVTGFNHSGYSYFLTTQEDVFNPSEPTDKYVSKIAQVCQQDERFHSYVEMEIVCRTSAGDEYNLVQAAEVVTPGDKLRDSLELAEGEKVLVAAFVKSVENSDEPSAQSAICIYKLADVRSKFTENLNNCFKAQQETQGQQFGGNCRETKFTIAEDYCGMHELNTPLAGDVPLPSVYAVEYPNVLLTALTVDTTNTYSVAFVGTSTGHIKKIMLDIEDDQQGVEFDDVTVAEGVPIKQDLHMSPDHKHIYAMTSSGIFKLPVSECGRFSTCQTCKEAKDPYCGWCSLENKCSIRDSCSNNLDDKRWLSHKAWECISINWYNPTVAPVKKNASSIRINVKQLPLLSDNRRYECRFGSDQAITVASVQGSDVICQTPDLSVTPKIPGASDHVKLILSLRSSETGISFLFTEFTFYNCSRHASCSTCTSTIFQCNWCIHDGKCTHAQNECNPLATPVFSKQSCPRLESLKEEILLPAGHLTEIEIPASNLPSPLTALNQTGYECLLHLQTPPVRVPAAIVSENSITCQGFQYNYLEVKDTKTVSLEIVWNGGFLIDDENAITVTAYKCDIMGLDCSMCMSLIEKIATSKYRCKWCKSDGGSCKYSETCASNQIENKCPDPYIQDVSPLSSPIEGGTEVTIKGSNLGQRFAQVKNAVTIAGEPCPAIEEAYVVSRQIVCRAQRVSSATSGNVQVTIEGETVPYEYKFQYQDPDIVSIHPKKGPKDGGTKVTVTGTDLDTGGNIQVHLGSANCMIKFVNKTSLLCETSSVLLPDLYDGVDVTFDGAERRLLTASFEYTETPTISKVQPTQAYLSGGRNIEVIGDHLDTVETPLMFLANADFSSNTTECRKDNGRKLVCPSPRLPASMLEQRRRRSSVTSLRQRRATQTEFTVGFIMDGVSSTRNVTNMVVFQDPVYDSFTDGVRIYQGGNAALELTGKNLNLACTAAEVTVLVGEEECVVKTLDTESLYCELPEVEPLGLTEGAKPIVVVRIGTTLDYTLGSLEYQLKPSVLPPSEYWIVGVAVGGGIVITVFIIIVIVYKRKSTEAERQYKKMQIQLDTLESNVRNECKQAFAELQTEVGDFTSDLNVIGIPFWDYKSYTFKVLFPSHNDHPILHMQNNMNTNKFGGFDQGLQQFNQLLNSKHFLLTFIRTLEQQKNFSIRDKAIVASLLMIVLQDKMEYATEILKSLLNELVDKSVERKHPKLMLRRTESVVEKLLANWLSLCMYTYLKKHAGKTLFMLFKAIKHQTEKGPIDAITSEARYSLSEDRLLREKIEAKTLNVFLVSEATRDPVACKLLDCDTITQAKEKVLDAIYMNTPFSRRPSVYDVDLEWRSGRSGHLPLQDEDVTTETIHGWKKVNSLAHYHVPDGATMALVPSRNKSDLVRHVHGMVEINTGSSLSAITPIITMEEGTKVWHLLKHDDSQNAGRNQKVISEIFLTRLLSTKGTLQQYVDDLFMTILRVDGSLPPAIKYLFDFLDTAARRHNIVDPEVVHTWKSNSLPLRFWVNIIKNPEFVFDIHKSHIVDSCLSVIAQTFMDACAVQEHRLGKDSPSNKLLFAKDIPRYRSWVSRFYKGVTEMGPVTDQDMTRCMTELSMTNLTDFNVSVALKELYKYANQYNFELLEALDDDPSAKKMHLANKFEQVTASMEGSTLY